MTGRLASKRALVTGAAKGLGAEIARTFVREGCRVMLTDIDSMGGLALAEELGEMAAFQALDVGDRAAWAEAIAVTEATFGGLDILVNNAGIMEPGDIETVSEDLHARTMRVHVDGTLWGCQAAMPLMVKSGGGSIINMASVASLRGAGHVVSYCTAKGAIESMTRAISDHCKLKANGVRANTIHPAGMVTPMVADFFDELGLDGAIDDPALGSPVEVAAAALFLASEDSRFMSGQRVVVDNGIMHMPGMLLPSA